jgi:hypothetical protein
MIIVLKKSFQIWPFHEKLYLYSIHAFATKRSHSCKGVFEVYLHTYAFRIFWIADLISIFYTAFLCSWPDLDQKLPELTEPDAQRCLTLNILLLIFKWNCNYFYLCCPGRTPRSSWTLTTGSSRGRY